MVGSARSGNTLLYHTLLSSGSFADYRGEPAVFDLLSPKFGNLSSRRNRERLLAIWLRSKMFRISGLEQNTIRVRMLNECRKWGDFLDVLMSEIARSQGLNRWAVWGPDNLLCMASIKAEIPDALFIHVIRDGRDVAVSMHREGWIVPFLWDRRQGLLVAALHWKWKVEHGMRTGHRLGADYIEVHFEDLVLSPKETLGRIGSFIEQDLDASRIRRRSIGTLAAPNSTFQEEVRVDNFQPVQRWRQSMSSAEVETVESSIGPLLRVLGYKLSSGVSRLNFQQRLAQVLYPRYFDTKQWLKFHTFLGRMTSIERLHLTP
ncbi:MAG: sulfotransferase [Candidatus Sulfotelmatobacter sp.]